MKRSELIFNLASIFVDLIMIMCAGMVAFYLRFRLADVRPIIYDLSLSNYLNILLLISPLIILLLAVTGLYNLKGTRGLTSELAKIFFAVSSGLLVVVVLFFFNQTVFPSRLIILMTWALAILFVSLGRIVLRLVQIGMLKQGIGLHRLVTVEGEVDSGNIVAEIQTRRELGYKVVNRLELNLGIDKILSELESTRRQWGIDEVLVVDPNIPNTFNLKLLDFCKDYGILFKFVPNIFETARRNVGFETISGAPIVSLKRTPLEGWGKVVKRLIDIFISFFGLVLVSPIFLLVALAVKLTSKGPVFFHQKRAAGLGDFEFYKFRSMHHEMSEGTASGDKLREELEKQNARVGPFVKIKNDPRVTPLGRFLRKTKLDEMPSLWHILRGQMSLVGPRVHMVKEVDHFRDQYKRLFVLKPGATGLTQITQATDNPEISWEEEINLDEFYIENWSISLDLWIIFKTILILLGRKPKVDY